MADILVEKPVQKKENFSFFAPDASTVLLAGDFTEWDKKPIRMRKLKDGTWKATILLEPGSHEYRFLVDGKWQNDENCRVRKPNSFGEENCVRVVR